MCRCWVIGTRNEFIEYITRKYNCVPRTRLVVDIKRDRFQDVCWSRSKRWLKLVQLESRPSYSFFFFFLSIELKERRFYRENESFTRNPVLDPSWNRTIGRSDSPFLPQSQPIVAVLLGSSPSVKHYSQRGSRPFSLIKDWIRSKSIGRATCSTRKSLAELTVGSRILFFAIIVKNLRKIA